MPVLFYPRIPVEKLHAYYTELNSKELGDSCVWPWFVIRIEPDGNARLCMDTLGNVRESRLRDLWNNHIARQMRRKVLDTPLFDEMCTRCCHRQY